MTSRRKNRDELNASKRRNRAKTTCDYPTEEPIPFTQTQNEEGEATPIYKGQDISLLKSYEFHVASAILENEERGLLKFHHHVVTVGYWGVEDECDDVKQITGLPIVGLPIPIDGLETLQRIDGLEILQRNDAVNLLMEQFGWKKEMAEKNCLPGLKVPLNVLRDTFARTVKDGSNEEELNRAFKAYVMYVMGCTLFCDKFGDKVPIKYLLALKDVKKIKDYAWGTACLAYLYRQLGEGSRKIAKQVAGYFTLVQAWILEHFGTILVDASKLKSFPDDKPLMLRWKTKLKGDVGNLEKTRKILDDPSLSCIFWDPYDRNKRPLEEFNFFRGNLSFMDIVEAYHPERIMRQFGRVQTIPIQPIPRGESVNSYKASYAIHCQEQWKHVVLHGEDRSVPVEKSCDCISKYLPWFQKVSHPFVSVRPLEWQKGVVDVAHVLER